MTDRMEVYKSEICEHILIGSIREVMTKGHFLLIVPLLTVLFLASCGGEQTSTVEPGEDTAVVRELVVVDSIGVELGDSNYVFGSIESSSHTPDGNILLLDRPACNVREFTPEGKFVRNIGRRGTGPGEFVNPTSMMRLTDGRIIVLDMQTGGLHTFSSEGEWEGISAVITNEPIFWMTAADSDMYVGIRVSFDIVDEQFIVTAVVGKFSSDSVDPSIVYWENNFPYDFCDFMLLVNEAYFAMTWTSDRDGNVFIGPRDTEEYVIRGFDINGEQFVEISLDFPMVAKSEQEIIDEAEFWNDRSRNMGADGTIDFQPDPFRWKIHSMGVDTDHNLWVRRGTEETPTFDIFDYDGNYLYQATIPFISGYSGLLWEIRVDEFGVLAWSLDPPDGYQKLYIFRILEDG